jgi:hypothetical protein
MAEDENAIVPGENADAPQSARARRARAKAFPDDATLLAFARELSILRDFKPLAGYMQTARLALDFYKPTMIHLEAYEKIASHSALFTNKALFDAVSMGTLAANKNLLDTISVGAGAASAIRITQDAVQTAAWGSILARASMPPPALIASLSTTLGAMSMDISKHISLNASILASARVVMPAISFGLAAQPVMLRDWMTGPIASALASFGRTQLTAIELAPVAFSTVVGAGVSGSMLPERPYEREGEVVGLESEMRAAGIELVRRHHPAIADKIEGARFALHGGNPDASSQAANSLVETIDQLLRTLVDETAALAWCRAFCPEDGVYVKDGREATTRAGKLRYLADQGGIRGSIAKGIATVVGGTMAVLQQAKHDESSEEIIRNFVLIVEGCAGVAISMTLRETPN